MTRYLAQRPWLFIVGAFVFLVSLWTCFIYTAVTRGPASFELKGEPAGIHASH
jgi:hypothetical protein